MGMNFIAKNAFNVLTVFLLTVLIAISGYAWSKLAELEHRMWRIETRSPAINGKISEMNMKLEERTIRIENEIQSLSQKCDRIERLMDRLLEKQGG